MSSYGGKEIFLKRMGQALSYFSKLTQ